MRFFFITLIILVCSCNSNKDNSEKSNNLIPTEQNEKENDNLKYEEIGMYFPKSSLNILTNQFFINELILSGVKLNILSSVYCYQEGIPSFYILASERPIVNFSKEYVGKFDCGNFENIAKQIKNEVHFSNFNYHMVKIDIEKTNHMLILKKVKHAKWKKYRAQSFNNESVIIRKIELAGLNLMLKSDTLLPNLNFFFESSGAVLAFKKISNSAQIFNLIEKNKLPTFTVALAGKIGNINNRIKDEKFVVEYEYNSNKYTAFGLNTRFDIKNGNKLSFNTQLLINKRLFDVHITLSDQFETGSNKVLFIPKSCGDSEEDITTCERLNILGGAISTNIEGYLNGNIGKPFLSLPLQKFKLNNGNNIQEERLWNSYQTIRKDSIIIMMGSLIK